MFFFLSTSVSCLKASLYCEAPMPHFLWTHSLHPGTLPSHCSIFIPVLCSSSHALLQPSHHIYEISSKTLLWFFPKQEALFSLIVNLQVLGQTQLRDPKQHSQVTQGILLQPSYLSKINGQKWMNEWMIISCWQKVNALRFAQLVSSLLSWYIKNAWGETHGNFVSPGWVTCSVVLSSLLLV